MNMHLGETKAGAANLASTVGVGNFPITEPDERTESLPIACGSLRYYFKSECAEPFMSLGVRMCFRTIRVHHI